MTLLSMYSVYSIFRMRSLCFYLHQEGKRKRRYIRSCSSLYQPEPQKSGNRTAVRRQKTRILGDARTAAAKLPGGPYRVRTYDQPVMSRELYQLS